MATITQFFLKLWAWIVSICGYGTKRSTESEDIGFYRATIVGLKHAGRLARYDIVPHRDESGGFHCAILQRVGSPALAPHVLQEVAKFISRDYFHRVVESLSWVYIPLQSESVNPEDILEFRFERISAEGNLRVMWSLAAPEVANAWISRAALAIEFGAHISVR